MNYKVGDIVLGEVTGIEDYGIFVKVEDKYTGLVHISEIIGGYVKDVNDFFKVGEKIYVHILEIDEKNYQMKLSTKNINYRINSEEKKAPESVSGFLPLSRKLDDWIDETLQSMEEDTNSEVIESDNKDF